MLTENMVKIQIAIESGAIVKNEKGERVELPKKWDTSCGLPPTEDCIKCYIKGMYYWSSAEVQKEIIVNGLAFDDWFEQQPIGIDIDKLK